MLNQQQTNQHAQAHQSSTQCIKELTQILTKDSSNNKSDRSNDNEHECKAIQIINEEVHLIDKQDDDYCSQQLDSQKSCDDLCVKTKIKRLAQTVRSHPYMKVLLESEADSKINIFTPQKHIKPKMVSKLVGWMEKLCFEVFNFSYQTYEISVKILKKYLSISNEQSNQLQMLGCVVLHIASKLSERTIISIDSYIECSMKLFTRQQFHIKQSQVFQAISCYVPCPIYFSISLLIQFEILKEYELTDKQMQALDIGLKLVLRQIEIQQQIDDFVEGMNIVVGFWRFICDTRDKLEILDEQGMKNLINKQMLVQLMKNQKQ